MTALLLNAGLFVTYKLFSTFQLY